MSRESFNHTDELNDLPWQINPGSESQVLDANGVLIASFEVRHVEKGVLGNCDKNADLAVRAVNAYSKRSGADIKQLQNDICEWADRQFPNRTTADILLKLYEELGEYARNPKSEAEFGDVMILLLDAARINGIDIHRAITSKMATNKQRTWRVDEHTRIMRHV